MHVTVVPVEVNDIRALITLPTAGDVIKKHCLKNNLHHEIDGLSQDANLHWLADRPGKDSKVVLYFHGGGYNMSADGYHVVSASMCASKANASLAMLEYTLAPKAHFPTQLIQAVEALKYVLSITSPSKVIITGDSAGGHLALSLLSHLMHPSQSLQALSLSENLGGIC
jgi:acetyl esterase/lipase